jgi:hypothetical protein
VSGFLRQDVIYALADWLGDAPKVDGFSVTRVSIAFGDNRGAFVFQNNDWIYIEENND